MADRTRIFGSSQLLQKKALLKQTEDSGKDRQMHSVADRETHKVQKIRSPPLHLGNLVVSCWLFQLLWSTGQLLGQQRPTESTGLLFMVKALSGTETFHFQILAVFPSKILEAGKKWGRWWLFMEGPCLSLDIDTTQGGKYTHNVTVHTNVQKKAITRNKYKYNTNTYTNRRQVFMEGLCLSWDVHREGKYTDKVAAVRPSMSRREEMLAI